MLARVFISVESIWQSPILLPKKTVPGNVKVSRDSSCGERTSISFCFSHNCSSLLVRYMTDQVMVTKSLQVPSNVLMLQLLGQFTSIPVVQILVLSHFSMPAIHIFLFRAPVVHTTLTANINFKIISNSTITCTITPNWDANSCDNPTVNEIKASTWKVWLHYS